MLVSVHTPQDQAAAVEPENAVSTDLDMTEGESATLEIDLPTLGVDQRKYQSIQRR
jgi:hypothetical protein